MRFVNSITDLGYYTHNAPIPCYCEILLNAGDLMLQAPFVSNLNNGLVTAVELYSADGLTYYGDVTNYFSVYYFVQGGVRYFNLTLNSFAPAMCANKCWILNVIVVGNVNGNFVVLFNKFTDRYCQVDCCQVTSDVTVTQNGFQVQAPTTPDSVVDDCGNEYIVIKSVFTCFSLELQQFFGIPPNVIQGTASFGYSITLNLRGRIVERPRTINRTISYNCELQRTETFIPYLLEQTEIPLLPSWKMKEVEAMFTADHLYVNDKEYQFSGGEIFVQLNKCWELFKLIATLQSCTIRQTYGCQVPCTSDQSLSFLIPANYNGTGFYDENRQRIADTFDQLLLWYTGQPNVTFVTDTSGDYENTTYSFTVQFDGFLSSSFYAGGTYPANRIFGTTTPNAPIIVCQMPDLGTPVIMSMSCQDPDLGTPVVIDIADTVYTISDSGNWIQTADSKVSIDSFGNARLEINVNNSTVGVDGEIVNISQIIGLISYAGRPTLPVNFTNSDSSDIPVGNSMLINPDGTILYTGTLTVGTSDILNITINNIFYGT